MSPLVLESITSCLYSKILAVILLIGDSNEVIMTPHPYLDQKGIFLIAEDITPFTYYLNNYNSKVDCAWVCLNHIMPTL